MSECVVEIDNLDFAYDREPILEQVNLRIDGNELVSLVGPNGGGKTTLLRLILGLLKPDRGRIKVLGTTPEQARCRVGYVPQYANFDLKFPVNVMDVVLMGRIGLRHFGPFRRADREGALAALAEVGLESQSGRPFEDLSGGQRQRVLVARGLASRPELLLLDEPTSNIDAAAEQQLYDLLTVLSKRLTVLLVSHDLGVVTQFVSSVVCVNRQVKLHPTSEFTGDVIREMYGRDVALVRHDHRCSEGGHTCSNS